MMKMIMKMRLRTNSLMLGIQPIATDFMHFAHIR